MFKQVKDCTSALTSVSGLTTNLVYNPSVPYADFPATGTWDDFFSNQEPVECPITDCTLHDAACASQIGGSFINIASTSPWVIILQQDNPLGYT